MISSKRLCPVTNVFSLRSPEVLTEFSRSLVLLDELVAEALVRALGHHLEALGGFGGLGPDLNSCEASRVKAWNLDSGHSARRTIDQNIGKAAEAVGQCIWGHLDSTFNISEYHNN